MASNDRRRRNGKRRWRTSSSLLVIGVVSLAALVVAVAVMAFGGDGEGTRRRAREPMVVSEEQQVTVDVVDNDFKPRSLTVRPGTEVTWEFTGSLPHTVTETSGAFDSGTLQPGDTFTMTFDEPGQYSYYCALHHAMQGTLVVAVPTPGG